MGKRFNFVFIINKPERETITLQNIRSAIHNINSKAKVNFVDYLDPNMIVKVLSLNPNVIMTYPFSAITTSRPFYIFKKLLKCSIVCFMTEGLLHVITPGRIRQLVGLEKFGSNLVDYEICWGLMTKELIAKELLKQNKISSLNRVLYFGHPSFENYFEPDTKLDYLIPEQYLDIFNNYPRNKIIMFVTGFQFSDYTLKDLFHAGDLIRPDAEDVKGLVEKTYTFVSNMKKFRKKYIDLIINCASNFKDLLFIVKMHPGEINLYKFKYENPYTIFSKYHNILLIDRPVPIRCILPFTSLLVHYDSTTMLEAYLLKIPTIFVQSKEVIFGKPLPSFHRDEIEEIKTSVLGLNSTESGYPSEVYSIISRHKNKIIEFKRNSSVEAVLKEQLDISMDKK